MKTKNKGIVITALLLAGMPSVWAQKISKSKKPPINIVLFVADDLGANDIGPYGNRVVRTPNINRLANESLRFTCAFASSPTCSPSRASIHTGLMPFRNGAHANHAGIKDGVQTLPVYLNALGYKVAIAGKLHLGPMSAYPFELIHNSNVPEPGYENKGVLWTDLNMSPVDDWLSKASNSYKPFMLIVNDHSPHVIWPEKPDYKASEVDIPSIHIDTEDTRKSRARYYTDISKMDGNVGELLRSLDEHKLAENTVVIFTCDQGPQWAFGKWNLYDYGIRVPLLIRWPGKIKGGTETDAMVSLVDLLPTAIELAGGVAPKEPEAIDGRSLLPLLSGEKNTHRDVVFACHTGDGTMNQSPLRMIRTRQYKYILNLAPEILYTTHIDKAKDHDGGRQYWPSWIIRSYENEHDASILWRYHNRPAEELYDVQKDPDETRNLANDHQYEEILKNFRSQMKQWRLQQGDQETGTFLFPDTNNKEPVAPYIFK
jgi:arylsulfatase A-like enzyme